MKRPAKYCGRSAERKRPSVVNNIPSSRVVCTIIINVVIARVGLFDKLLTHIRTENAVDTLLVEPVPIIHCRRRKRTRHDFFLERCGQLPNYAIPKRGGGSKTYII